MPPRPATATAWISLVTAHSQSLARNALRPRGVRRCSPEAPVRLLPAPDSKGSAGPNDVLFEAQQLQGRHPPLPLFLARFHCLRINRPVTATAARLDTAPVASGYAGGLPTRWIARHCKAATLPKPRGRVDLRGSAIRTGRGNETPLLPCSTGSSTYGTYTACWLVGFHERDQRFQCERAKGERQVTRPRTCQFRMSAHASRWTPALRR